MFENASKVFSCSHFLFSEKDSMDNGCKNIRLLTKTLSKKEIKVKLVSCIFTSEENEDQNIFCNTPIANVS